jgi:hypothetical protein
LRSKIQEQKFQKSRNKNYNNMGIKITKIQELKSWKNITKIWEQKLQVFGNESYNNLGTKIT